MRREAREISKVLCAFVSPGSQGLYIKRLKSFSYFLIIQFNTIFSITLLILLTIPFINSTNISIPWCMSAPLLKSGLPGGTVTWRHPRGTLL